MRLLLITTGDNSTWILLNGLAPCCFNAKIDFCSSLFADLYVHHVKWTNHYHTKVFTVHVLYIEFDSHKTIGIIHHLRNWNCKT